MLALICTTVGRPTTCSDVTFWNCLFIGVWKYQQQVDFNEHIMAAKASSGSIIHFDSFSIHNKQRRQMQFFPRYQPWDTERLSNMFKVGAPIHMPEAEPKPLHSRGKHFVTIRELVETSFVFFPKMRYCCVGKKSYNSTSGSPGCHEGLWEQQKGRHSLWHTVVYHALTKLSWCWTTESKYTC